MAYTRSGKQTFSCVGVKTNVDLSRGYGVINSYDLLPRRNEVLCDVVAWKYRMVVIRNADDVSWVLYPRPTWWALAVAQETYLAVGAQWLGDDDSELGRLKPLVLLEVQWFV
ncbi:hypothetical protein [Marinobacter sp. LV10R510-11A]|uniref:hypothetical protein n=1 Tax=Marinobacter sp. LV10R510-11A TaxID=1415568 RepID=UPI0015612E49|nr:hypothetical protein [Marinobacter sp. LV10R510-11A]